MPRQRMRSGGGFHPTTKHKHDSRVQRFLEDAVPGVMNRINVVLKPSSVRTIQPHYLFLNWIGAIFQASSATKSFDIAANDNASSGMR